MRQIVKPNSPKLFEDWKINFKINNGRDATYADFYADGIKKAAFRITNKRTVWIMLLLYARNNMGRCTY